MKTTLIYDGQCSFCHRWARRFVWLTRRRLHVVPFQVPEVPRHYGVRREDCEKSIQLVTPQHRIFSGAEAAARALTLNPWLGWAFYLYRIPGIRWLSETLYHWTALHRYEL